MAQILYTRSFISSPYHSVSGNTSPITISQNSVFAAAAFAALPRAPSIRLLLAAAFALSTTLRYAPALFASFTGIVGWLFSFVALPRVVSLIADRHAIPLGLLAVTAMQISLQLENSRLYGRPLSADDLLIDLVAWLLGAGMSLLVTVPIHLYRRGG